MRKFTYILLVVLAFGCSQKTKPKEENTSKPQTLRYNLELDKVKALVARDSVLNSLLRYDEEIIAEETFFVTDINGSVGIYLAPMQDPVRKYYLLFTTNGENIISLNQLNGAWVDNDETEFEEGFRFLSGELIYKEDISNDGEPELIIKDRIHNGTFNAAVKHLYAIKGFDVEYLGDLEYIMHIANEDKYIVRHWDTEKAVVEAYLKTTIDATDSLKVGSFDMRIENDEIQLGNLQVIEQDYESFIVPSKI